VCDTLTLSWGTWLARNAKLFEGNNTFPLECATQSLSVLCVFPQFSSTPRLHVQVSLWVINETFSWEFFYGASQGNLSRGGVIFLFKNHCLFQHRDWPSHKQFQLTLSSQDGIYPLLSNMKSHIFKSWITLP
jgi:hypothetical protein